MWRCRRLWRKLLNLVDHLPRNSHFVEALASDEGAARRYLEAESRGELSVPPAEQRHAEWSPEVDRLARIEDLLAVLIRVTAGSRDPAKPVDRPRTAIERLRSDAVTSALWDAITALSPDLEGSRGR